MSQNASRFGFNTRRSSLPVVISDSLSMRSRQRSAIRLAIGASSERSLRKVIFAQNAHHTMARLDLAPLDRVKFLDSADHQVRKEALRFS